MTTRSHLATKSVDIGNRRIGRSPIRGATWPLPQSTEPVEANYESSEEGDGKDFLITEPAQNVMERAKKPEKVIAQESRTIPLSIPREHPVDYADYNIYQTPLQKLQQHQQQHPYTPKSNRQSRRKKPGNESGHQEQKPQRQQQQQPGFPSSMSQQFMYSMPQAFGTPMVYSPPPGLPLSPLLQMPTMTPSPEMMSPEQYARFYHHSLELAKLRLQHEQPNAAGFGTPQSSPITPAQMNGATMMAGFPYTSPMFPMATNPIMGTPMMPGSSPMAGNNHHKTPDSGSRRGKQRRNPSGIRTDLRTGVLVREVDLNALPQSVYASAGKESENWRTPSRNPTGSLSTPMPPTPAAPSPQTSSSTRRNPFTTTLLPKTRGLFIRNLPSDITLAQLFRNIRGGAVERVEFNLSSGRNYCSVYFVLPDSAERYRRTVNEHGGIYWGGADSLRNVPSFVGYIGAHLGGHEPIKPGVALQIANSAATRVLLICGLPLDANDASLKADIQKQSSNYTVQYESCEVGWVDTEMCALLRFGSIGTALGARKVLAALPEYRMTKVRFEFLRDECEGDLAALVAFWDRGVERELAKKYQKLPKVADEPKEEQVVSLVQAVRSAKERRNELATMERAAMELTETERRNELAALERAAIELTEKIEAITISDAQTQTK
ncbi:hypothetical protein EDC01DRAFT_296449 [Geopyxis carbonaria]|nr:hypothetical protein EDC01DRAFT_296449 [Geopyxis carbonaria]